MARALRINYVAYCDPFAWHGGGEAVTAALLEEGRRMGHEIRRTCAFPAPVADAHPDADFWILADVHNVPRRWWRRLPGGLLGRVIGREPYIHVDTAYVDVCDLDYLPCNGEVEGEACPFKRDRWFRSRRCFRLSTIEMYRRARLNVFLSPLHRRTVERLIGAETVGRSFEMRPVIDTTRFVNHHGPRDIDALYVGVVSEAKGAEALAARFPGGGLTVAGTVADRRYRELGRQLGHVPYGEMPALFNRARRFVHLPRWPEPQGRTVAEAALCGCVLETNERVGATSFGLDLSDPASCEGAVAEAWDAMLDAAGPGSE
jgi:glycosyltransferase involved in cell wall biosynthesis